MSKKIVLIAHNIRSTYNIGSIFRTCDGLGVDKLYLTGYSPYPKSENDQRLPYISEKINKQINKTALGAETYVNWQHKQDPIKLIDELKLDGYKVVALEQDPKSISLDDFRSTEKIGLVIGEELNGVSQELLKKCDNIVEIPMQGSKESLNVAVATAIAIWAFTSHS